MKKLLYLCAFVFCNLLFAANASAQCQGNVYITSLSWQTANSVHGFTSTELDYCAGLYYDPADWGSFTEGYNTGYAVIGESYSQGYADSVPASLGFDYYAPINNGTYTTNGNHYVIAYYLVYVPYWNDYYWYDPWSLGFSGDPGWGYYGPDYYGYWGYVSYWVSSPQYVGSTSHGIGYTGQSQCLPGQQFTQTGQPCSSLPGCESGQQFSSTGQLCPNYVPPPPPPEQPYVTVHAFNNPLRPKGTSGGTNNSLIATCITGVQNSSGLSVKLQVVRDTSDLNYDGGHRDSFHTGQRPMGTFQESEGVTGSDGCYRTRYFPPHISGVFRLKSTISGTSNDTQLGVWFPDLTELRLGANYNLIGADNPHPENHWGTWQARDGLIQIANDYANEFYGGTPPDSEKIAYNDISLWLGGKFDIVKTGKSLPDWTEDSEHAEHREGINCDVRSNNIDRSRWIRLKQIFRNRGSTRTKDHTGESRPHWHLRFEFNYATVENPNSQMQNGIEQNFQAFVEYNDVRRTPSSIITDVGSAIFDRQITQQEFESWFPQISNAKAQGLNAFLQEVKTFEKQLFASQEYIARQRTGEQFVQDVFASHLFRQPTTQELSYWVGYLSDIEGTQQIDPTDTESPRTRTTIPLSQTQRRQIFLDNFENLPDFVNLIASVVEDSPQ